MHTQRVRDAMEALLATNPEAADRDELADHVRTVRELRTYLDAYEVRCVRRSRELAGQGSAEPPASLLANHGGQSSKDAANVAERERVASQASSFEDALGDAEVSAGHLDALAVATKSLDATQLETFLGYEDRLLAAARTMSVDAFTRECRGVARQIVAASTDGAGDAAELDRQRAMSNVKRWVDKSTGMHHSHLELDPVSDAIVWGAIDAQLATIRQADGNARTPWKRMQVDAVIAAVGSGPGVDRIPEIMVLTDLATLVDGLHANSVCETVDGCRCRCRPCGGCAATPTSFPRYSAATARSSTSAGPNARRTGRNGEHYGRCIAPAPIATAPWGSRLPDPPREVVVARPRPDRHLEHDPALRTPSSPRSRRRMDDHDDRRPRGHLDPTRRNGAPRRQHHRPGAQGSGTLSPSNIRRAVMRSSPACGAA
jgi:hypothetical protein